MFRFLSVDQFLGSVFERLVQVGVYEIELSHLTRLAVEVDRVLRSEYGAFLMYSETHALDVVHTYSDIFELCKSAIVLKDAVASGFREREDLVCLLQQYFTLGIPDNVRVTLLDVLSKELG